jgi:fucose 4-O-acetylase-like acetyltransferase
MNGQIQSLRGFACVLLVFYHVIGADAGTGLRIADGTLRWVNDGLAYLRMPLFTFLSGMVYGLRPFNADGSRFMVGKARRLLVPMLVVGTALAILQAAIPGTNARIDNWWLLHIKPVGHFWFVESLFWVFTLVWLLENRQLLSTKPQFAVVLTCAVAAYLFVYVTRLLGLDEAIYLLPYFLCGLAVTRFELWEKLSDRRVQAVLLLLAVVAIWQLGTPVANPERKTAWMLTAGVTLCGLCLVPRVHIRWLAYIGTASYAIYIFHVFFTAASRIALEKVGLAFLPLQIAVGLAAGLIGPVLIDRLASPHRWPALLLLGKSAPRAGKTPSKEVKPNVPPDPAGV